MVFEKNWENMEGQFELQNSGPSEVGFERPTLYKLWKFKFEMCRRRFTSVAMAMCGGMRRHHRRREIGAPFVDCFLHLSTFVYICLCLSIANQHPSASFQTQLNVRVTQTRVRRPVDFRIGYWSGTRRR